MSGGIRAELTLELENDAIADADQQITSPVRSGRLAGLLEIRDRSLPALDRQRRELAAALRLPSTPPTTTRAQCRRPPLSVSRTDLPDFAGAGRSGSATFAVVDTSDGSKLVAFQIDIGAAADEAALAAQIDAAIGAFGSAAINADGNLEIAHAGGGQGSAIAEGDSRVSITDGAGRDRDYGLTHDFGLNGLLVEDRSRPSDFEVRADIGRDPSLVGNLDEEMARMVQLQRAYSVAARLVAVTEELLDELLAMAS